MPDRTRRLGANTQMYTKKGTIIVSCVGDVDVRLGRDTQTPCVLLYHEPYGSRCITQAYVCTFSYLIASTHTQTQTHRNRVAHRKPASVGKCAVVMHDGLWPGQPTRRTHKPTRRGFAKVRLQSANIHNATTMRAHARAKVRTHHAYTKACGQCDSRTLLHEIPNQPVLCVYRRIGSGIV